MKIALVHDYIKDYGGAEKVLLALHEIFPEAPIYTSVYIPKDLGPHRDAFEELTIKTSFLQYIPFKEKLISVLRVVSPLAFKQLDLSPYDVIVVSQTGAYFPNAIRKSKNQKLITYTHTPPRYLYGYKTAREWQNNPFMKIVGELVANHFLRMVDFDASQQVDQFIANSEEVAARIKKFYRKDSVVIYPPAIEKAFSKLASSAQLKEKNLNANQLDAKRYYLTGGRLARSKGTDIIIKAFNQLGLPLKIFGKGFAGFDPTSLKLRGARENIEFMGEVTDEEKFELMHGAKAFIFASFDEDFGITPVEAMSVGTPVIAYKSGGVKETVIDRKTGLFYEKNTPESLAKAIKEFGKLRFNKEDCIKQAEKFSEEEFRRKIKDVVNSKRKSTT